MSLLLYCNNTINYIQQLTQNGLKDDLGAYTNRIRSKYKKDSIVILIPIALLLSGILITYANFLFVFLLNTLLIAYIILCHKVIALLEKSQNDFLNMCQLIITFEIQSKNSIQIGKYNSEFGVKHDRIIERFTKRIEEIIGKHQKIPISNNNNNKVSNQWTIYLQLKPFIFKFIIEAFNESYCRSKLYFNIYFNNSYYTMITMLSKELDSVIGFIEMNQYNSNEQKEFNDSLNLIESNNHHIYLMKRISDLLNSDLNQINKYNMLIKALKGIANCNNTDNNDTKSLLNDIITHKVASLTALDAIHKELFPSIESLKEDKEEPHQIENGANKEKGIISQGKPYSLFDLIISQRQADDNNANNKNNNRNKEQKAAIANSTSEKINLFELLKGEREVRSLKTSLIDELAEYHQKHKINDEIIEEHINTNTNIYS